MRKTLYILAGLIVLFALLNQCNGKVKTVIETKTVIEWKTDTIIQNKTIIKEVDKPVYVQRIKTIKGKDSIIYKDKPSETTTTATQFKTKIQSNKASANLLITSTGEVLDVQGTITYPEKETITNITKIRDASGLFMYGSVPIHNLSSPEVGLMYQFKNKVGIMGGVQYNNITNKADFKLGFLIKL